MYITIHNNISKHNILFCDFTTQNDQICFTLIDTREKDKTEEKINFVAPFNFFLYLTAVILKYIYIYIYIYRVNMSNEGYLTNFN